jgi:hypothetical protein
MTDGKTSTGHEAENFTITSTDVEGLIRVLGAIAGKLTKGEWGLLLSILAGAGRNVEPGKDPTEGVFSGVCVDDEVITEPRNKAVDDLLIQLRNAHMPNKQPSQRFGDMITPPNPKPKPQPIPNPNPNPGS